MNRKKCKKCNGSGTIAGYYHVSGGRCFRCGGNGIEPGYKPPQPVKTADKYDQPGDPRRPGETDREFIERIEKESREFNWEDILKDIPRP